MLRIPRFIVAATTIFSSFFFSVSVFAKSPDKKILLLGDARLDHKFTFEQRQARIGEVFDAVEKQTGIHLTVEDRDGAAGEMISVFVRDLPVADLMISVWSLVSFQRGEWRWIVTEDKQSKTREYRLIRPAIARDYSGVIDAEIKKYFEALMEANIRASHLNKLSSEDAAEFPEALLSITDKETRLKERAFASLCTPQQRLQLLRGQTTLEATKSDWTPEVQAYINYQVAFSQAAIDSHPEWKVQYPNLKAHEPQKIEIRSEPLPNELTPNLWFMSHPVVGSTITEKFWQDRIAALWLQPGDMRDDTAQEAVKYTPTESNTRTQPPEEAFNRAVTRLKQFHEETGLPVLVRMTGTTLQVPQDPKKINTVGDSAANLREHHVLLKWRDGILLAMDAAWLLRSSDLEAGKTPWNLLRQIRDQIDTDPAKALSFGSLCRLAGTLNENQLRLLDKQQSLLSARNAIREDNFGDILSQNLQPILAELGRRPELATALKAAPGVAVRSLPPAIQDWAKPLLGGQIPLDTMLRLTERDYTIKPVPTKATPTPPAFTGSRTWHFILFKEGAPDPTQPANALAAREFTWNGRPISQ